MGGRVIFRDILEMTDNVIARACNRHTDDILDVENIPHNTRGTEFRVHLRGGETIRLDVALLNAHHHVDYTSHPVDDNLIKEIEAWLRRQHPVLGMWSPNNVHVLYGLVQAGKTELILSMIWITQHVHKTACALILANMTGSYHQVCRKNLKEFNYALVQEFGERASHYKFKTIGFVPDCINEQNEGDYSWLRIAMGNPSQLKRLTHRLNGLRFVIFCDEADVHVKGFSDEADGSSTGPLVKNLMRNASGITKITASPFALLNQVGVYQKTIIMPRPVNYRGFTETEWVYSIDMEAKAVRNGRISKLMPMLVEMVAVQRPRVESATRRYLSILVNGPCKNQTQKKLAQAIVAHRPDWNVFVMNSDGRSCIKQAMPNHLIDTEYETISSLYKQFEERNNGDFQIYIIVACQTASRAISFRPTSRSNGTGGLHGMIFFPSRTCHAAQLIQYMRIWGKYDEDYPIIRVRTTKTVYNKLKSEINHNLNAFAEATSEMGLSREQIKGVHVVDIGLHDRRAVDDTHVVNKTPMLKVEFNTEQDARAHLVDDFGDMITVMTERIVIVRRDAIEGGFNYGEHIGGRSIGHQYIQKLKELLGERVPLHGGFQICWHNIRYEEHHTMTRRFGHTRNGDTNYMSRVVAGSGNNDDDFVNVIVWKPQFSKKEHDEWTIDSFQVGTAYLFQTTKNTWRYYTCDETRKVGVLTHRV